MKSLKSKESKRKALQTLKNYQKTQLLQQLKKIIAQARSIAGSLALATKINELNVQYSIGLNTVIINPGATASDHASFWNRNFTAILLIEAYQGGDFNKYYHSVSDRINYFNTIYFYRMSKLAVAGIMSMVTDVKTYAGEVGNAAGIVLGQNFPNPVTSETTFSFYLPESCYTSLKIYNQAGLEMAAPVSAHLAGGSHQVKWDVGNLPGGLYMYRLQAGDIIQVRKMMVLK